jgi:hypothetical protein
VINFNINNNEINLGKSNINNKNNNEINN